MALQGKNKEGKISSREIRRHAPGLSAGDVRRGEEKGEESRYHNNNLFFSLYIFLRGKGKKRNPYPRRIRGGEGERGKLLSSPTMERREEKKKKNLERLPFHATIPKKKDEEAPFSE